jgi:hypothetical protein
MSLNEKERQGRANPLSEGELRVLFAVAVLIFLLFIGYDAALRDGDIGWHLATGRWMVENVAIPHLDPFSYTMKGSRWVAHEWLSELLMYCSWSPGGWPGLRILFGVVLAGSFLRLGYWLRTYFSPVQMLIPLGLCLMGSAAHIIARPHLFGWLLMVFWLPALLDARGQGRAPHLAVALLMTMWANLHGSFLMGLLLIGPVALEALLAANAASRAKMFKDWFVFGLASLLAALATPHGIWGILFPLQVSSMKILPYIGEWAPTDLLSLSPFVLTVAAGAILLIVRPTKLPVMRALTALALLALALMHVRHQAGFIFTAVMLFAGPLGGIWSGRAKPEPVKIATRRDILNALSVGLVVLFALSFTIKAQRPVDPDVPEKAIAAIPPYLKGRPVFNDYSFGGAMALKGIPVFIDGRADMYGDPHSLDYIRVSKFGDTAKWNELVRKFSIEWTIMPPDRKLVSYLDKQPDWHRVYSDDFAVIQVRQTPK